MPKLRFGFGETIRSLARSVGNDSMVEEVVQPVGDGKKRTDAGSITSKALRLDEISAENTERWELSMHEFSRVLGGGIVPGSIVLVGGDPGIGKSTLLLQAAMEFAEKGNVLYVSGEESGSKLKCVPSACYPKEMAKK